MKIYNNYGNNLRHLRLFSLADIENIIISEIELYDEQGYDYTPITAAFKKFEEFAKEQEIYYTGDDIEFK